jgi:hypothetical protein
MDPTVEPEVHHHHHTGHRWLDITLGVSAIIISVVSLFLAFQQGDATERMVQQNARMVQASTWPYVMIGDSNGDDRGNSLYKLFVINNGVGPAKIETLQITYKGQPVASVFDLAKRVATDVGDPETAQIASSDTGGVVPARQTVTLLTAERPVTSPALINAFRTKARQSIDVHLCYCSIFDECWTTTFQNPPLQPTPVKQCKTHAL